jgi:hypothetical protein
VVEILVVFTFPPAAFCLSFFPPDNTCLAVPLVAVKFARLER